MSDPTGVPGNAAEPTGNGAPTRDGWSSLLDNLPLGLILADGAGRLREANPAAASILGLAREDLLALDLDRLQARGTAVAAGTRRWVRESGATILLGWAVEPLADGSSLVRFEDITEAQAQAAHLERLTQLYAALSQVNQAIVWSTNRKALLDKICEVMVEYGKFTTAWIGWNDPVTHEVEVTSQWGDSAGILEGLQVRSDDSPLGRGAVGTSIREGHPCVINDFLGTPEQSPWHAVAVRARFAAVAAFPIRTADGIIASLAVYASQVNYFGPQEIALLVEVAGDVAFALEHLELELSLRESEERYRTQFELSTEGILALSTDGELLDVNEAFARMHGYTRAEVLGMTLADLDTPASGIESEERLRRILAGEEPTFEVEHRHKDGHSFPLEVSAGLIYAAGQCVILNYHRDITQRKQMERALRQSEASYRGLFDSVGEAICIQDRAGRFLDVNRGAAEMFGLPREELIGRSQGSMSAPGLNDLAQVAASTARAFAGEPQTFEFWGQRSNGEGFLMEQRFYPGSYFGQEVLIALSTDITEKKRAEEALRQAQKLESLGVLAGGIAHDFNNLLTAIMGNLNLAQAAVGEYSQSRPYLEKVENTVVKAAELSRQMLAYSGKGHFVVKPRDLNAIIQEMAGLLAASLPKKIRLEFDPAPVLPKFKADGVQIQQVVMNLITNAAESIGNQEGRIRITTFNADLDREVLTTGFPGQPMEAGNYIVLSVVDTGCGMSPEVLSRIFDPFFTTKASGRGLGLSAMLGILKGHKAGIRIETAPDQGTTFEVFFPALEAGEAQEDQVPARRERRLAGTVLLVDDEEIILESTGLALESLGFRVVKARDGVQALEQFLEMGPDLALVFMDLSMPRMDGTSTFMAMHRARPKVPVVLTSGYDQKEATEDLLALGLAGFVQKPYRIRDLARELDRILTVRD